MGGKTHGLAPVRSPRGYLLCVPLDVEGKITLQRGAGQRHQLQEERLWTPPCKQLGRGTCDPSYMSHPSFLRRTARARPAGCLGCRRFVVPLRVWLRTSRSRQGRARRHFRKSPSPINHRSATEYIAHACREAAITQIDAAGRERTSRSNFTAIMDVHVQRRRWLPLSGVGCDSSPTGV